MTAGLLEEAVSFGCADAKLFGVLHRSNGHSGIGVVVVVGGPQYRVGSHRQFVHLGRAIAQAGMPTLRFDVRGMGDSEGEPLGFERQHDDIRSAIGALQERTGAQRVVLWGLCDGASAALLYLHASPDPRVAALCLVNPWVRSEASLARTHVKHYYGNRLFQAAFWKKILRGEIGARAAADFARNIVRAGRTSSAGQDTSFQERMALGLLQFSGSTLLLLSGNDYTAKEFVEYAETSSVLAKALRGRHVVRRDVPEADHTFSEPGFNAQLCGETVQWLNDLKQPRRTHSSEQPLTDAAERQA